MKDASLTPRQIASALTTASGDESFEATIQSACGMVFEHWRGESQRTYEETDSLRMLSESAVARIRELVNSQLAGADRDTHFEVFEALLSMRSQRLAGSGLRQGPAPLVADLMAVLAGQPRTVLDPACGIGSALLAVGRMHPGAFLTGYEADPEAADLARERLALAGLTAAIHCATWDEGDRGQYWEAVIATPPPSQRFNSPGSPGAVAEEKTVSWSERTAEVLSQQGRTCVLLPAASASRSGTGADVRNHLLRSGRLRVLIELPAKSILDSATPACLWVSSDIAAGDAEGRVLVVNLSAVANQSSLDWESINAALSAISEWLDQGRGPELPAWLGQSIGVDALVGRRSILPSILLERRAEEAELLIHGESGAPERSLLTELRLDGFKSVGKPVTIPLRPLTLVFGKNSAGKSSILQSLLLMKQSINKEALNPFGPDTHLGSFTSLIHDHDARKTLTWGVTFAPVPVDGVIRHAPGYLRDVTMSFQWNSEQQRALPTQVHGMFAGNQARWTLDPSGTGFRLPAGELTRITNVREDNASGVFPGSSLYQQLAASLDDAGLDSIAFSRRGLLPGLVDPSAIRQLTNADVTAPAWSSSIATIVSQVGTLVASVDEELRDLLSRIVYLGPLRKAPTRLSQRGEVDGDLDIPFHLLHNVSQRRVISENLQRLGMRYRLDAVPVVTPSGDSFVGELAGLVLTDTRTGVRLSPSDVGFGVSQVLPIIVELSARTESIIMVEQPEIHLHPGMQAELTDLLIESVDPSGNANQVIAETHSESMVLRLQRRVKEGTISNDDVAIIYVDQNSAGDCLVSQLRLDDRGDFLDEWPHGFFTEQFDELFGGL